MFWRGPIHEPSTETAVGQVGGLACVETDCGAPDERCCDGPGDAQYERRFDGPGSAHYERRFDGPGDPSYERRFDGPGGAHYARWAGLALVLVAACCQPLRGADSPPAGKGKPAESAAAERPVGELADSQRQIAEKYERLEQILLRMSELTAGADPRRAALLKKAVAESKQRMIGVQLKSLVDLLAKDQLSPAIEGQESVDADLHELLELLLTENRSKRIESEKARIRQYLKQLNEIINRQKDLQARTTGGAGQAKSLSQEQSELGGRTGGLAEEIRRNEEAESELGGKDNQRRKAEPEDSDGKGPAELPKDAAPGPAKPGEDGREKASSQSGSPQTPRKSAPAQPGESPTQKPSEPSSQPRDNGGQQPADPPRPGDGHPARQRLEEARRRMEEARTKLEQAEREGAAGEQEEAIRQLQQAKAELEDILRQLREEEIEQMLVALEARLVQMLQMQREVHEGTQRLDKASSDGLSHEQEIEAGRLSSREAEIVAEADKTLLLLREDATAVAFPEALSQARDDMQQVAGRLAAAKTDQITLSLEEEIIAALEDMVAAVRKAIEDAEQRRSESAPGQSGAAQSPPLVDLISELQMIRALQMRVNARTDRYVGMISGSQADGAELLEALRRLADRQERIYQVTRDLETGRNR